MFCAFDVAAAPAAAAGAAAVAAATANAAFVVFFSSPCVAARMPEQAPVLERCSRSKMRQSRAETPSPNLPTNLGGARSL